MWLGLALFFIGAVLLVVQSRVGMVVMHNSKHEELEWVFIAAMVVAALVLCAGLVLVFLRHWWLALILFFIVMPRFIQYMEDIG